MKGLILLIFFVVIGLLVVDKAQAWDSGSTGICSDEYGNNFPCSDEPNGGGDDGWGDDDGWDTGSGGDDGSQTPVYTGPTWEEQQQIERQNTGVSLNETGNQYFENGDYENAVSYYQQALSYLPDDTVIQDNLRSAEGSLFNVKGNELYEKGDYKGAVEYYQQAFDKKPDNEVIRQNLVNAQDMAQIYEKQEQQEALMAVISKDMKASLESLPRNLKQAPGAQVKDTTPSESLQFMPATSTKSAGAGSAGAQLKTAKLHSHLAAQQTSIERMKEESSKGFDTTGIPQQGLPVLDLKGVPEEERDPVIPEGAVTPQITELVKSRTEVRQKRYDMQQELEGLQQSPQKDTVKIADLKQKISDAKNQEIFFNFSISEELKKAPQVIKEDKKK